MHKKLGKFWGTKTRGAIMSLNTSIWVKVLLLLVIAAVCIGLLVSIVLGVYWVMWSIWCAVIPALFPTASIAIKAPGYWIFSGAVLLIVWAKNLIFKKVK